MAKSGEITRKITQDNFVTEKIDVITNNLLGSYDDEGNYFIAPQIIKELISLPKRKRSSFGNSVFCVGSLLGYGELVFELLFDAKTHNGKSATASIYLLEDVDKINGYLQNTIKTHLDDFSDSVENFIIETYQHFNVLTDDDDNDDDEDAEVLERKILDDLENEDSFIIAKKQFSLMLERLMSERYLDAYGKYFTSRISVLTKLDNDFSKAILDSFYRQYSMIHNIFLQEQNYKNLNELLDKCFEEMSGTSAQFVLQEKEYNKTIQPYLDTFVNNVNHLNEKCEPKALHMLDKDDRKKVKEILDKHEKENSNPEYESKPSVEQMVNDVPKNIYTKEGRDANQPLKNEQEAHPKQKEEQKHFIEELKDKKPQEEEKKIEEKPKKQNFYDQFKEQHSATVTNSTRVGGGVAKVVDTSKSKGVDTPTKDSEVAVTSLRDRMSRLEKFKSPAEPVKDIVESQQSTQNNTDKQSSIYDMLTREKAIKDSQIDTRYRRKREEMDMGMEK